MTALGLMLAAVATAAPGSEATSGRKEIILGADFIERHATNRNGTRLQTGVIFSNGYVAEAVSFKNVDFPFELTFEKCDFLKAVDFSFARFQRRVALHGCVFSEPVTLDGIQVEKDLDLTGSVFLKGISMEKAHIQGRLQSQGVVVGGPAEFAECRIDLTADFGLHFLRTLDLQTADVSTNDIIQRVLKCEEVDRCGSAEGMTLTLAQELPADPLPEYLWFFHGKCSAPFFYAVWQKCYKTNTYFLDVFKQTVFLDTLDMTGVHCGSKFLTGTARFYGRSRFEGMKVDASLYMAGAYFLNFCSFGYAQVSQDLDVSDAQFSDCCEANFYGLRAGRILMRNSRFGSKATFANATASLSVNARGATFTSTNDFANFNGLKVGGTANFKEARFAGPVSFILASIGGNFDVESAQFHCAVQSNELARITAPDPLHFHADFGSMQVDGFTIFSRALFCGDVSFRNARLQHLHLDLPGDGAALFASHAVTNRLRMEGCVFKRIRAITNETFQNSSEQLDQSWQHLRDVLSKHAPYSADIYQGIEDYFQREGQTELADEVYIESRRREREELSGLGWVWNWFLDKTVRYGRKPWWALVYGLFVMALGAVLFKPSYMIEADSDPPGVPADKSEKYSYSRLAYSIDQFLPVIPLQDGDLWVPRKECRWIWWYLRFHTFVGWVLMPIALAAFSGIVK